MIKTFISHSHSENHDVKENLVKIIDSGEGLQDCSVSLGDIDENLSDQEIRRIIRDKYLIDTTVTIVVAGKKATTRKHIDWEIFSSMHDGSNNGRSGIVVVDMNDRTHMVYPELKVHYPSTTWYPISISEIRKKYSDHPDRLVDNYAKDGVLIVILPYSKIINNNQLLFDAIKLAHSHRNTQKYDLSTPMRKRNNDRTFFN